MVYMLALLLKHPKPANTVVLSSKTAAVFDSCEFRINSKSRTVPVSMLVIFNDRDPC